MIELEVLKGELEGNIFKEEYPFITIGRLEENRIVLSDYHVSSEHAQIFWEDNQYIFRDLRSTNGSILVRENKQIPLDGSERWEFPLKIGDKLLLGAPYNPVVLLCKKISSPNSLPEDKSEKHIIAARTLEQIDDLKNKIEYDQDLAAIMYRLVQTIGKGGLKLNTVLKNVSLAVTNLLERSTNVSIYLKNPISSRFKLYYFYSKDGLSKGAGSKSLTSLVLKRKAAVLIADASEEMANSKSIFEANIQSIMAVPFWNGNHITGVLQCDNRGKTGLFKEKDLEYLTLLSYQSTLAIENAQLYEVLEAKKEKVQSENTYLKKHSPVHNFSDIIGESDSMKSIFSQLLKVLDTRVAIHIQGETGTGKELIANAIHYQSRRRDKMFVAQNCAALPDNLLESELFGHVRGAFTGAEKDKKGLFEIADGGSLFLDEIADMSPALQVKLLRVIQEGEIRPVGSTKVKYVDVRIISATHKCLEEEVAKNCFREDLYYRLHVFPITLPPLRERKEDIPLLVKHFIKKFCRELQKEVTISDSAMEEMKEYRWKGNIRELENEIHRLIILADEAIISPDDLNQNQRKDSILLAEKSFSINTTLKGMVEEVEKYIIRKALGETGGNKTKAAKRLGITREGLHKKISKYKM
jgi:transcriptional regulator with GAF, ATPase, and Fis domain